MCFLLTTKMKIHQSKKVYASTKKKIKNCKRNLQQNKAFLSVPVLFSLLANNNESQYRGFFEKCMCPFYLPLLWVLLYMAMMPLILKRSSSWIKWMRMGSSAQKLLYMKVQDYTSTDSCFILISGLCLLLVLKNRAIYFL